MDSLQSTRVRAYMHRQAALAALLLILLRPSWADAHAAVQVRLRELNARLAENPTAAGLYLQRGEVHRIHGDLRRALDDFRHARRVDPTLRAIDFHEARLLLEMNRPRQAITIVDRFLAAQPGNVTALVTRARAREELGEKLQATRDYSTVLSRGGIAQVSGPQLYVERARALASLGGHHVDEALHGLDEGLRRLGPVISLQLCALELELARGSYENALARLDRILPMASRKEAWWVRRGEVLDEAGRCHEAREAFENARAAFMRVPEHRRRTRMMERIEARILTYLSQPVFSGGES